MLDHTGANQVFRSTLIGEVDGRDVLLVDDIINTAGSVVSAINELKTQGARNINLACVHPLFTGPAWERLTEIHERSLEEGWTFNLVGTSVIEHENTPDWYHTFRIESLVAQILEKINSRGSVTGVQEQRP